MNKREGNLMTQLMKKVKWRGEKTQVLVNTTEVLKPTLKYHATCYYLNKSILKSVC